MGNLMDKFYNLVGVDMGDAYENEEYYDDYAEDVYEEPNRNESYMPSRRSSARNTRVNRNEDQPDLKLVIMQPVSFEEARDIANHLKHRKPIVVNLEAVDTPTSRRIVDFLSGAVYALDGDIQKVSNGIFLIAPNNVSVANEDSDSQYWS